MSADDLKIRNPVGVLFCSGAILHLFPGKPRLGSASLRYDTEALWASTLREAVPHLDSAQDICIRPWASSLRVPKAHRTIAKGCPAKRGYPGTTAKHPTCLNGEPQRGYASASRKVPASIPHIPFIPFNAVFAKDGAVFFLEGLRAMVFGLAADVFDHGVSVRLAHGKNAVTRLPMKGSKLWPLSLHPNRAGSFQFLHPLRQRNRARHPRQDMNVIRDAANGDGVTFQFRGDATEISMHRIHLLGIREPWFSALGREHQMYDHIGKRLRQPKIRESDTEPLWGSSLKWVAIASPFQGSGSTATLRYDAAPLWGTKNRSPKGLRIIAKGWRALASLPWLMHGCAVPFLMDRTPTGFRTFKPR